MTCSRLVVFSGIFGFFHQYNWYNWNIVERGVNHHGYNNIPLVFMFMSNNSNDYVNRSRNICVTNDHDYVPHVEQEPLTLQHMSSLPVLTGVRVFLWLVFCVVFVDHWLSFCPNFAIVLSLLLWFTASDYPFVICKLLLFIYRQIWTDYDDNISMRVYSVVQMYPIM